MIVEISKEQFLQAKQLLKMAKTKNLLEGEMTVTDCIDGVWGLYKVKGVWKTANRYKANMELVQVATSRFHAALLAEQQLAELSKQAKNVNIIYK